MGEWLVMNKPIGFVVIPMIAFIEGRMEIPMRRVTWDYLMDYRLTPIQCSPNVFRVLRCVDMLNRKMGNNLTWHDINWVCRVPSVRLISYLPDSSKGMDEDFSLSRETGMTNCTALLWKGNHVGFPRTIDIYKILPSYG